MSNILGVYSKTVEVGAGIGSTAKKVVQRTFWFVRMLTKGNYELRALNANHIPAGPAFVLAKKEFMSVYSPEPDFYIKKTVPGLESLAKRLEKGEENFKIGELDEAEQEFYKALRIDEDGPKANIVPSDVHAEKSDYKKLDVVLKRILHNDQVFKEEQRHLFNDFAINLRKDKLFEEAIVYYAKAIELNPDDENLHFNIARAFYDRQNKEKCLEHLRKALAINPGFKEARLFLDYCQDGADKNATNEMTA
ncbi:MAG: tetratricopeptide repeat protein [Desulfovibrionaceae bacterium]|nr:tetratricopeptide repeat protein [Desulfovibrionaceae bacterium]MBF0514140.1 tetratricopeptide repeat protein [Desulfovibrionaceae bacterium]